MMDLYYASFWLIGYGLGILTGIFTTAKLARQWACKTRLDDILREYDAIMKRFPVRYDQ